jgi:uncharacterized protein involved in outer membrane biogenesis
MHKRFRNGLLVLAATFLVTVLLILCGVFALNLTPLKTTISRLVESTTGLVVSVSGPLHLRLGLHPQLQAVGLELMSGDGAGYFLRLASLDLKLELSKLLAGELVLNNVVFSGLVLDACMAAPNMLPVEDSEDSPALSFSLGTIDGSDVDVRCAGGSAYLPVHLDKLSGTAIRGEDVALVADARWRGRAFELDLASAPLEKLLYSAEPQSLMISAKTSFAELELDAEIEGLLEQPKIHAKVSARLDQPDNLLSLFDIPAAGLPAISLQGRVGQTGEQLSVDTLNGYFGGAAWSLSGSLNWGKERPLLVLDAQFDQLDIDTLQLLSQSATNKSPEPFNFDSELPLQLLDMADVRIDLQLSQLRAQPVPPADLGLRLELEAGQAQIDILKFHTGPGDAVGRVTLDRSAACPAWEASAALSGLDLSAIGKLTGIGEPTLGTLETGEATLKACGTTLRAIRESLEVTAKLNRIQIQPAYKLPHFEIDAATLTSGWRRPTQLEAKLLVDGQSLNGRIETGELALFDEGLDWPVVVKLGSGDAKLKMQGIVRGALEYPSVAADVTFKASRPGPILSLAGFNPGYRGKVALDLHADIDDKLVSISGLKLALGNSDLQGSLKLAPAAANQMSDLVLRSRFLDVVELQQVFASPESTGEPSGESLNFEWPIIKLDLAFDNIHGFEGDITDLRLTGSLREKRIENASLAVKLAEFAMLGQLDADFSVATPTVSLQTRLQDIDLGSLIRAVIPASNADVRAGEMQLHLTSSGGELQKLAHNLELDFVLRQLEWNLPERWPGDEFQLKLHEITGTARPEIPVALTLFGELDRVPLNGWVQLAPVHQLLDPLAPLPVRAVLGTNRETVMVEATIERDHGAGLEATVQLSAMNKVVALAELHKLHAPLPGLVVAAGIDLGPGKVETIELAAELGDSRLEGSVVVRSEDERSRLEIALNSPHLQTTDLSALVAAFGEEDPGPQSSADGETTPAGFLQLVDESLEYMPKKYDFDIEAKIDELVAGEHFLGAATLSTSIKQQNIELGILKLSSPRGSLEIDYSLDQTAEGLHSKLDVNIDGFELGGLLKTLDLNSDAGGELYVDASLDATAPTVREMPRTVGGRFDLALFPRNISADVLDLWASNLIFALMPSDEDGTKQMNCLVSRFEIEDGIMHSKVIMLDSTDVIVRGKGDINLGERELDLIFAPQAKLERFLSVSSPMSVSGPFDDFHVGMAGAGLVGTAFRWYLSLVYVPWKWLTGERYPADGRETCLRAIDWQEDDEKAVVSGVSP